MGRREGTQSPRWPIAPLAVLAVASLAAGTVAHGALTDPGSGGAVTWHDDPDGDATRKLSCEFWGQGTQVSQPTGTIQATHAHGPTGLHTHELGAWEGEPDGPDTFRFHAGPLTLHASGPALLTVQVEGAQGTDTDAVVYTACEDEVALPPIPDPCSDGGSLLSDDINLPDIC